ncbi:MAG TPA: FAD-dependent oxidoreductase [Thermoanaerobaculia bacterium]|nr:FAD-dependent oxidoreductase [Thermoanaerobaculia bacterium]
MIACDVAVIGAGPAGSAVARRLAMLGHDVAIVERRPASARPRFAETLAPGVNVHLATLGIELADAVPVGRKLVRWRGGVEEIEDASLLVDRARFDAQLLRSAAEAGVRVLQPCTFESAGVEAAFVVDASGRANALRWKRESPPVRTFALRARWNAIDAPPEMRVATVAEGWLWGVRGAAGDYHVCAFLRREAIRDDLAGLLEESGLFPFLTSRPDECHACDATPHFVAEPLAANALAAGDTACAIDPLSSSGIQTALGGAIAASLAIHTILRAPERRAAAAAFYAEHVRRVAARHRDWTATHHANVDAGGPFWRERVSEPPAEEPAKLVPPQAIVALDPRAALVDAPVVAGDFIETRRVVRTPRGEHVAYLGSTEVAPLLANLGDPMTAGELAHSWQLAPRTAIGVLQWLVANEVLGRVDGG